MFKKIWTPDMIVEIILSANGKEPLNSHYFSTTHPQVYAAAERIFGSWGNAIIASGLDYNAIRKYRIWSKMRIISAIKKRYRNGEPLSSQQVQNSFKSLYMASVHHFKSWGTAIRMAGLDYDSIRMRRSMTEQQIRDEIRRLYHNGEDMAYSNMRKNHQYLLAYGMKKLGGGSWAEARRACGITENYRLRPDKRQTRSRMQMTQLELF
ncbi:MAG: hypothetical protein E7055_06180 [Lentisphaerae bacterium]|nr:hypothetical protein [Lentisphaerota bacterium]